MRTNVIPGFGAAQKTYQIDDGFNFHVVYWVLGDGQRRLICSCDRDPSTQANASRCPYRHAVCQLRIAQIRQEQGNDDLLALVAFLLQEQTLGCFIGLPTQSSGLLPEEVAKFTDLDVPDIRQLLWLQVNQGALTAERGEANHIHRFSLNSQAKASA